MRQLLPLLLLAACTTAPAPSDAPSDDDTDVSNTETGSAWETGTEDTDDGFGSDDGPGQDTAYDPFPVDPDIGATTLDGTWTGTFNYTDVVPLAQKNPKCEGTVTFEISGRAQRHVIAEIVCTTWDPNFQLGQLPAAIAGPYGRLDGLLIGTLDPANLTEFPVDASIVATNMTPFSRRVRVRVVEDQLVVDFDNVAFGIGQRVLITASRATSTP